MRGTKVLLQLEQPKEVEQNGVVLPTAIRRWIGERDSEGRGGQILPNEYVLAHVLAVGPGEYRRSRGRETFVPTRAQPGQRVLLPIQSGYPLLPHERKKIRQLPDTIEWEEYRIVEEAELMVEDPDQELPACLGM